MICEVENRSQSRRELSTALSERNKIPTGTKHVHGRSSKTMEDGGQIVECHHRWQVNLLKVLARGKEKSHSTKDKALSTHWKESRTKFASQN